MDKLAFSVLNKHLLTTKLCVIQLYSKLRNSQNQKRTKME